MTPAGFLTVKGAEQRLRRLGSTDVYIQNQIRGALHHGENSPRRFPLTAQQQMIGKEEKHHPVQVRAAPGSPLFRQESVSRGFGRAAARCSVRSFAKRAGI